MARAKPKLTATALVAEQPFGAARPIRKTRISWSVLGVISAGGVIGACARYSIGVTWPHPAGRFPWATFTINVAGCLLIGVLMVAIIDVWPSRKLFRPFLGTGVLGGYTTFSTYIVDAQQLIADGEAVTAFAYLAATALVAILAVYLGSAAARAALSHIRDPKEAAR